jgi:putative membrane protein
MANDPATNRAPVQAATNFVLWACVALYVIARILQVFPSNVPMLAIVALHVVPPLLFALVHGAIFHRARGILIFFAICLVVGNVAENVGARTGFPYGKYYFTAVMGPKLFAVPILLGLAYLGMAYLSWTLARVILGGAGGPLLGRRLVVLPLVAAFIMVAWDFSMDPVWSTIVHAWIWLKGGAYFGVPVSNFLGWYLTVYVIFQLFALYCKGRVADPGPLPPNYWRLPVLFYGASAAGNLLLLIPSPAPPVIADASGAQWRVTDIVGACALVSVFLMGALALLAWMRVNVGGNQASS